MKLIVGKNDLATTHPNLTSEWHPIKNENLLSSSVSAGSHRKVWWQCSSGHEWQALISNRARLGRGCPYCSRQLSVRGETDFATTNPELLNEWDYTKNVIQPNSIMAGTHKKVWWICSEGHSWEAEVKSRVSGVGCPYCNGKRVLKDFNDLASINPGLTSEWNYEKNAPLTPDDVTHSSGKKVWWTCKNGHNYQASIDNRSKGRGCPICASALRTSFPEQAIFYYIKQVFPDAVSGYKDIFTSSMELDIFIPSIKVGIEYDGKVYHTDNKNRVRDAKKYNICKSHNIILIRIREMQENYTPIIMCDHKIEIPSAEPQYLNWAITNLCYHLGKTISPDVVRDRKKIQQYLEARSKSLLEEYPEIAKEWNYELNYPFKPEQYAAHSNERVAWLCSKCGHSWYAAIGDRTRPDFTGCPKCARKAAAEKRRKTIAVNKGKE